MAYIGQRPVIGRYIKLDQISSGFNGSNTGFSMTAGSQAVFPGTARNLLLSLGGVIQEPDTDFTISGSTLTFTTPPVANTTFFGVIYGDMQATGTPSDGTVLPASIASSGNFSFPEVTVTGDVNIADSIIHSGDTDTKIRFPAANKFSVETGGAERLSLGTTTVFNETGADVDFRIEGDTRQFLFYVDATNDRIGIDRSSPDAVFHIFDSPDHGNDRAALKVEAFRPKIRLQDRSSSANSAEVLCDSNALRFNVSVPSNDTTNLTERLRIDSSGNVGIGTSSPSHRLHVIGDGSNNLPLKYFRGGSGVSGYLYSDGGGSGIVGSDGDLNNTGLYFVNDTSVDLRVNGSRRLLINSSGNVGIGTTSPAATLHVEKTVAASSDLDPTFLLLKNASDGGSAIEFINSVSGKAKLSFGVEGTGASTDETFIGFSTSLNTTLSEAMRIDSSGRVGIGDTSPDAPLVVRGTPSVPHTLFRVNSQSESTKFSVQTVQDSDVRVGTVSNHPLALYSNSLERMRIDTSGRVLIGGSSSQNQYGSQSSLQVQGTEFDDSTIALRRDQNNANPPGVIFAKSRSGSIGGSTIVQSGDQIGTLLFAAADGNDLTSLAAEIKVQIDGTPGSNDVPGRISFHTTADGAASPTERMRIDRSGRVRIGTTSATPAASNVPGIVFGDNTAGTATVGIASFCADGAAPLLLTRRVSDGNVLGIADDAGTKGLLRVVSGDFKIRSTNNMVFETNSANERLRIDSSGDVLIGTTTSAGKLTVDSGTSNTCATFQSSDAGAGINLKDNNARSSIEQNGTDLKISSDTGAEDANSTIKLQIDGSTRLRINADGNTSFNGSSAVNCDIDIDGEQIDVANPLGNNVGNGVNPTFRVFASNSNKSVLFSSMWGGDNVVHKQMEFAGGNRIVYDGTADNEMARFTGDDFLVGTTSNSATNGVGLKLNFGSTNPSFNTVINQSTGNHSFYHLYNTNATHNAYRFYVQVNGGIANHSGNNVNLSDERMKKNITNMGSVYSTFKQFVFRDFNYIDDEASESKKHGVIAQEVETIDADLITDDFKIGGDKDENYVYRKALKEEQFVMIGLKALQEAITKIDTLEAEVAALKAA